MSKMAISYILLFFLFSGKVFAENPENASSSPWSGSWSVKVEFKTGQSGGLMQLDAKAGKLSGNSQPLDENKFFPLQVAGHFDGLNAEIIFSFKEEETGSIKAILSNNQFEGSGFLFGVPISLSALKIPQLYREPTTHHFVPDTFSTQYTTHLKPVLALVPGDTVSTFTLDNEGRDKELKWKGMPGNTLTGPFYLEGANPGDTLVVHLKKVAINRDTAKMYSEALNQKAIQGGYKQTPEANWGRTWLLDRDENTAQPQNPSEKLKNLKLPLEPMLGSIGVAPPLNQAIFAGDIGFHGGNLDYNRLVEGTTIYLPVWHSGAYLFLGDGHALQGDGEISGQGLETSLDVEFEVDLIKGKSLRQVWSENDEYIMVSGVDNTLDSSLQMATTGMSRWLKENYNLNDSEVATILSAAIEYDIAEIVDPRPHVVAKIKKTTLSMINN